MRSLSSPFLKPRVSGRGLVLIDQRLLDLLDEVGLGNGDLRRPRTALRLRMIDHLLPHLRAMHAMEVDLPHEELQLCAPAFRSFFYESSLDVPRYRAWYAGRQHHDAYAYLHRVLQLLQRGGAPAGVAGSVRLRVVRNSIRFGASGTWTIRFT